MKLERGWSKISAQMSLGLSAYGSKYVLCRLGGGGGGGLVPVAFWWPPVVELKITEEHSLVGFVRQTQVCQDFQGIGRGNVDFTHSREERYMLRQSLFFCRHLGDLMGQGHMEISGAHSQQIMQQVGFTEILQLAALVRLSRQFTHKPPVFNHAENWKSCLLSSGFFLL